jgi:hydroxycarboxylate dehydrogenase B
MWRLSAEFLRAVGTNIFRACGAPEDEAALVAGELVDANLMGYDSHGLVRCTDYVDYVQSGRIKPGVTPKIITEHKNTAIVDCGLNFGQVGAKFITDLACSKAEAGGISYIISRNCQHVGRVGSFVQRAAERGFFAFSTCNGQKSGHVVSPWGGREGRLATNPLAYAAPTNHWPVVLDMTTCMIAHGKVHLCQWKGKPAPPGCLLDADGHPTTDPNVIIAPKPTPETRSGTIRPFGSEYGYKGYGLSMMVEIMGGIMAGLHMPSQQAGANGYAIIVIDPDAFCGREVFKNLVDEMCAYVMSSAPAPGFKEVVVPGLYDFRIREERLANGIPMDETIWKLIVETGQKVGVQVPESPATV